MSLLFKYLKYKKIEKSNKRLSFKRIISLSLIFLYLITFITAVYAPIVSALDGSNPNDDNEDVWLYNNTLYIRASSTKANSWIKYQTIGYTAKVIIGGDTYKTRLEYSNYLKDASDIYSIPFTKNDEKNTAVMESLIDDNPTAESVIREYWRNPPGGEGIIWFDAIMIVKINGISQGIEYNDAYSLIHATYRSNEKDYQIPWTETAVQDINDHFNKEFTFKSQKDYMEEDKNPAITLDFDLYQKVYEYQPTGFNDKSTSTDTEITNERVVVTKVSGGGTGLVYPDMATAENELAKGLPEGIYDVYAYIDNEGTGDEFLSDDDTKRIEVIKQDPDVKVAIAIEAIEDAAGNSIDTVEVGQEFIVTARHSMGSVGAKIISFQHFGTEANGSDFTEVSEEKEFKVIPTEEGIYTYYVIITDTEGSVATSSAVTVKAVDNAPALAHAKLYTPILLYEGIYEHMANLSTVEYKGDTYDAKDAAKMGIGRSRWNFLDLDLPEGNHGRLQTANYEKKDFSNAEGGQIRINTIGNKQVSVEMITKNSRDIDPQAIQVIALPKAKGEIIGNKKNREIYIYNKSLFKPRDAWQTGENGDIDNSKTKIIITNLETGQTATSTGGSAFNSTFVKGVSTTFGEVDQDDYTHIKNDVTAIIFVGDDESDQKTETFKIRIEVTDKRGNTDSWEETKTIFGDQKPVALLKGLFSYIRNPVTRSAYTDIEVHSYSPDLDTVQNKITLNGTVLSVTGDRDTVSFTPTKTGEYTLKVNIVEKFISNIISALRGFLTSSDEKQDTKEYTVTVDNIAPTASFSAIKPSYINMQTFINNDDIASFDNEMTTFISDMQSSDPEKNITINNVQSSFINQDGWFDVTDRFNVPSDMINEVNAAKAAGHSYGFMTQMLDEHSKYFVVANAIQTDYRFTSNYAVVTYRTKARFYDLKTKSLVKENIVEGLTKMKSKGLYPFSDLSCDIGTYDDLTDKFYVPTEEKIKQLDASSFSAGFIYSQGVFWEDENQAYYTTGDYIGTSSTIRSFSVKRYDKNADTTTTILSIGNLQDYVPGSIVGAGGRSYGIQTAYINSAIVNGQYLVVAFVKYSSSDDDKYIPYVIHFNSSGNYIRTASLGVGSTRITTDLYNVIQNGYSTGIYLPFAYECGDISQYGSYNVNTGAVIGRSTDDDIFHINHKFIGLKRDDNGRIQIYSVENDSIVFTHYAGFLYPALKQFPAYLRNNAAYDHYAIIYDGDQGALYAVDISTGSKKYMYNMGNYFNDGGDTTVIGDYYYYSTIESNIPILKRANYKTGQVEVVDSYLYNFNDYLANPDTSQNGSSAMKVLPEENSLREIREYWVQEPVRSTGAYKIQYTERIIDSLEKLNNYPSGAAQANLFPIITSKTLGLSDMEVNEIIQKINEINTARGFTNTIKIIFLDIGGLNATSGQHLASTTGGVYYSCTNSTDAFNKLGSYIKSLVTSQKGTGTIHINVGDTINLTGSTIDYEGDTISIEEYRSSGYSWGSFHFSIQNLGSNRLKFNQTGTYVLEYRTKDAPPTVNTDTSKYSNTATLTVVVGNGGTIDPVTPLPPDVELAIKGSKSDGSCVERHRVDFIVTGFQGTNAINWSTLNIQFNQTDYLPYTKPTATGFSRIFTNTGNHSVTVTLKDTAGLTVSKTFYFNITADQAPTSGFSLVGDGYRNSEEVAEFKLVENVYSSDDQIGSVEYFTTATKYTVNGDGNVVADGTLEYPLLLAGDKLFLNEKGTKQIKQMVTEYYENGTGLDGVDLDAEGYRVFKTALAYQYPEVKNIPPEITYSVAPAVILKGSSIGHALELVDDTELGDTVKYRFTHNANLQNSDGVNPLHNTETDEPTMKLNYKGLYDFYTSAADEDGEETGWVHGGQVKVVTEPIADFELYSDPSKNSGENLEYQDNIFKSGSTITFENLSSNPDYGLTREDHGLEHMKVEYKKVGDESYITVFEQDMSDYKYELDLPIESDRAKYSVKLTVRSVDGFESTVEKQYTLLELRMDASLDPDTVYASQSYTIKATLSKDALGAVAKIHDNTWVTLNKTGEDTENIYYEKSIATLDTIIDKDYNIEVYGEYPFNNELREDLTLKIVTPIELKSNIEPIGPTEYVEVIQDNAENNDYIRIPASEKIFVEAQVTSPITISYVKAQLEGETETNLAYNNATGQYEGYVNVPSNKADKDYYELSVSTEVVNGNIAMNSHRVKVDTPSNLRGYVNTLASNAVLYLDEDNALTARTSKYVNNVKVNVLGTEHSLSKISDNGIERTWRVTKFVDISVGEISGIANFTAITINGIVSYDTVDFKTILPLTITGDISPNPAMAGEMIYFNCDTTGYAEDVEIELWNNDVVTLSPDEDTETNNNNTWRGSYIVPLKTPDGVYTDISAKAYRGGSEAEEPLELEIIGNIYQLVKPRIRKSN